MFKFNKNVELLETIEKQKEQLTLYENRLRDVVSAYKSLQTEKQALEASVKALTECHSSPNLGRRMKSQLTGSKLSVSSPTSSRRSSVDSTSKKEQENAASSQLDTSNEEDSQAAPDGEICDNDASQADNEDNAPDVSFEQEKEEIIGRLKHQISTLTISLSTVAEEKSKIVATYKADKKKLRQETENQISEIGKKIEELRTKNRELEQELSMVKEKVRTQQEDREQEQSTHSIMLRELQKMLNDERNKNEQISNEIQEARRAVQKAESGVKKSESGEKKIKKLTEELENTTEKLRLAREEAKKPSPLVIKLQKDLAEIKAAHRIQVEKEHIRVLEAEGYLKQVGEEGEERVTSLENQITELSNQMGSYESTKTRDQMSIQKLKERISQVEAENGILAKQVAKSEGFMKDEENLDLEELKNHIIRYKGLLKIAAQQSDDPIDVTAWFSTLDGNGEEDDYKKLYFESQHELRQVKEEFEKYKVRAQNVLKNKRDIAGRDSISFVNSQQQVNELKAEIEEIKERHFHLRAHCDGVEERQKKSDKEHEEEMLRQHLAHQKDLEASKDVFSAKILESEQEMRSQRERTVALLAEKDKEIQHLQAYSNACHKEYQTEYEGMAKSRHMSSKSDDYTFYGSDDLNKDPPLDSVAEIMNKGTLHDTTMIHYAEQMARKDVSINGLRRHKKQLELQIRQLQDVIMMKDEKNSRELAALSEKIAHFTRNKSRENANLEYLKNVMFQYLTTTKDQSARNRMLQAVITILQFSPDETKKVLRTK